MKQIKDIKARLAALPVTEWHAFPAGDPNKMSAVLTNRAAETVAFVGSTAFLDEKDDIATFIAHAPEDVRLLVDTLEALARSYPSDVPPDDAEAYFAAKKGLEELGIWFTDAELAEQAGVTVEEYQDSLYA